MKLDFSLIRVFFKLRNIFSYPIWSIKKINVSINSKIDIGAILSTNKGGSIVIKNNTIIHSGARLEAYGGKISLGMNCSVNPYSVLYGHGGLSIGDNVRIATHVVIIPANHLVDDPSRLIIHQGMSKKGITIEDDCWIGANSTILDGVVIKKGSVIGAGCVVSKSTEKYGIYIGNPAHLLRYRGKPKK